MDCAVEVNASVVCVIIGVRVGECTARFWSGRSLSNYVVVVVAQQLFSSRPLSNCHMARRRGCLWIEPLPCGLHVSAGEPQLLHLRTARLLPGMVTSSLSGLVSWCWEWMAASHTFSCSRWGNLCNKRIYGLLVHLLVSFCGPLVIFVNIPAR